jgi:hypothetical protein
MMPASGAGDRWFESGRSHCKFKIPYVRKYHLFFNL